MSATVNAEKFADFFGGCPIIRVPGRTFPVEVKYLEDSIEYCQWEIGDASQINKRGFIHHFLFLYIIDREMPREY